tara:strand:- start:56 stop:592 length:537 start_codon:yes stop_codon:yes gene_type:complete
MKFYIKENAEVAVEFYPYAQSLNEKILEESKYLIFQRDKINADGGITNVKALQTEVMFDAKTVPSMQILVNWLFKLDIKTQWFKSNGTETNLRVDHFWLANYSKGDFTISHHHKPAMFSFVYFVRCPKGSSPLVFTTSKKRVKAEEGKIVVFPGHVLHHVPKNNCEGRVALAGNIGWL